MVTVNEIDAPAGVAEAFDVARSIEHWPRWLPHYRWVRLLRRDDGGPTLVEMAARRSFGPLAWPVWWRSEMRVDPERPCIAYRHVAGVTAGMDALWTFTPLVARGTRIRVVHRWEGGPRWPLVGPWAAERVIGPHFVHAIAGLTLAGLARELARRAPAPD